MDLERLKNTLEIARTMEAKWMPEDDEFELGLSVARTNPSDGRWLGYDVLLQFEHPHAIAVGWDGAHAPEWLRRTDMSCLSPWPFSPQECAVRILKRPLGEQIRVLHGELAAADGAPVGYGFGLSGSPGASCVWLQIWAERYEIFTEEGPRTASELEKEVKAGQRDLEEDCRNAISLRFGSPEWLRAMEELWTGDVSESG